MLQGSFRFGDWLASPNELLLTSSNTTSRVEPKTMSVLELLAHRAPEVVSIEEMIELAWAGTVVGDNAVYRVIKMLRQALGDNARDPSYIESISRRGYRLKTPVEFLSKEPADADVPPVSVTASGGGLGHLVIAVEFGETIPEDTSIGASVARFLGWCAEAFKVQMWPPDNSAADYLLNLHLSTKQTEQELSWELLERATNTLVFASNDNQVLPEASTLKLRIAETVAEGVSDQIRRHKTRQMIEESRDAADLSYWELVLTSDQFASMDRSSVQDRENRLLRAVELYDSLAPARAAYADLLSWRVLNGLTQNTRDDVERARNEATRAIESDRDSPYVLSRCGAVFARLGEYPRGVELCRRAMELAPSTASREALSRAYCFAGDPEKAIPLLEQIMETMPRGHVFRYGKLVVPLVQAGRLQEALDYSYRSISNFPGDYYAWVVHCNVLMQFNLVDEALAAWQEVLRLSPAQTLENNIAGTSRTYGRNPEQARFLTGGLLLLKEQLERY